MTPASGTNSLTLRSLLKPSSITKDENIPAPVPVPAAPADVPPARSKRRTIVNALRKTVDKISGSVARGSVDSGASSRASTPAPLDDDDDHHHHHGPSGGALRTALAPPTPATSPPPPPPIDMKPLTDSELAALFVGTPRFALVRREDAEHPDDRDDDEEVYALRPEVTFPFGAGSGVDGDVDYRPLGNRAFTLCTVGEEGVFVHEVPAMASFTGVEPGTVGWEYFLMLPVGDSDRDPEGFEDELDEGGRERGGGMRERGGVRSVEVGYIVERLKELGGIWQGKKKKRKAAMEQGDESTDEDEVEEEIAEAEKKEPTSVEMYTHLFTHLLHPPTRITTEDYHDPYSLKVQIMALIQALAKKVWLDFGNVRWRIKLGQILWGNIATAVMDDDEGEEYEEWEAAAKESERVLLLLQILLACELLVRMDSVLSGEDSPDGRRGSVHSKQSLPESREQMVHRFRAAGGVKVQWDILLARRWLDNIRIVELDALNAKPLAVEKEPEKSSFLAPPSRWFTSQPSPEPSAPTTPMAPDVNHVTDALLLPRHSRRQVEGLLHFARKIQWPNIDMLTYPGMSRTPPSTSGSSVYGTPLGGGTPRSVRSVSTLNSYFAGPLPRPKRLRELTPEPTLHRKKSSTLTVPSVAGRGGWLSRSYLTGLILPGEGLSHLVMSTLLENDPMAVEVLGFNANLYGGFQYLGKTWWSRHCIVGRVMAGYDGAGEECGWVGPVMGSGVREGDAMVLGGIQDGWVDVITLPPQDGKGPRALEPELLGRDGDVRGKGWKEGAQLMMDSFVRVRGMTTVGGVMTVDRELEVQVRGLSFTLMEQPPPTVDDEDDDRADLRSFDVAAHFSVGPLKMPHVLELRYDVSFIAAWPCFPPSMVQGHPLHRSLAYTFFRIEELDSEAAAVEELGAAGGTVLVVNTWAPEQRVFVYAWCAQRGKSAVVATRGRTCIACAIREANALALGVVVTV